MMLTEREATSPERFFIRSTFSIVTMVARIKGHVTEEIQKNAVKKVQKRHLLLRVRIRDGEDHTQWFVTEDVQEIPIEIVARKSEQDWIEIHAEGLKIPFEFETHPTNCILQEQDVRA